MLDFAVNEADQTLTTVFRYDQPEGITVPGLGDIDRLANGSYVAAWGGIGTIEEILPDGTVAWRARLDREATIGRMSYFTDIYGE